jgi:hypothetical protein
MKVLCLLVLISAVSLAMSAPHVNNLSVEDLLNDLEDFENQDATYSSNCKGFTGTDKATIVKAGHLARAVYTHHDFSKAVGPQGLKLAFYMADGPDDLDFGEAEPAGAKRPWVVFGGSESTQDWKINFDLWMTSPDAGVSGKVHQGFQRQWSHGRSEVTRFMAEQRSKGNKNIFFTGHSLGGAVATVAATEMQKKFPDMTVNLVTFGAPKVGNKDYIKSIESLLRNRITRAENSGDPVPCIPPYIPGIAPYTGEIDGSVLFTPGKGFENGKHRKRSCVWNLANLRVKHHSMDEYIDNFSKC